MMMVTSHVLAAVARTILAKMEVHAQKYVSPRAFGTIVFVQKILWADTVCLKEKAARPTKLREKESLLVFTQSLMTAINISKCSVAFIQNPGLHGT